MDNDLYKAVAEFGEKLFDAMIKDHKEEVEEEEEKVEEESEESSNPKDPKNLIMIQQIAVKCAADKDMLDHFFDFDASGFRYLALTVENAIPNGDVLVFFSKKSLKKNEVYSWTKEGKLIKFNGKEFTEVNLEDVIDILSKAEWSYSVMESKD